MISDDNTPRDLDEAIEHLKNGFGDRMIQHILSSEEDDFVTESHFSIGLDIRNNWRLWQGSTLSVWFNDRNIHHPDDMSGIILTSLHRKLHNKVIDLKDQIKVYVDYWRKYDMNEK